MNFIEVFGRMFDKKSKRPIRVDNEGKIVEAGLIEFTQHPFGHGALTTTGVQYSPLLTTVDADTDFVVDQVLIGGELPPGRIIELESGLTANYAAVSTATADIEYRWRARDAEHTTWALLHTAADHDDTSTTHAEETYSGYWGGGATGKGNRLPDEVSRVPFWLKLDFQCNEANEGECTIKNSSYVKVKYIPD